MNKDINIKRSLKLVQSIRADKTTMVRLKSLHYHHVANSKEQMMMKNMFIAVSERREVESFSFIFLSLSVFQLLMDEFVMLYNSGKSNLRLQEVYYFNIILPSHFNAHSRALTAASSSSISLQKCWKFWGGNNTTRLTENEKKVFKTLQKQQQTAEGKWKKDFFRFSKLHHIRHYDTTTIRPLPAGFKKKKF